MKWATNDSGQDGSPLEESSIRLKMDRSIQFTYHLVILMTMRFLASLYVLFGLIYEKK